MINFADVSYAYKKNSPEKNPALNRINLDISEGEFVVFLGHNGSGKSTLAKLLNGLLLPSYGKVTIDGLDTKNPDDLWRIRERVGMVFQNPDNQIVATVVEEDVAFGPENLGLPASEIRTRVDEALATVKLREHARREPHLLSGGEKQRVAIAGALAMRPKYLVLDEPTSQLDPGGRKEIKEILHALRARFKTTIVYITHFVEEAIEADRVLLLQSGRVTADGAPKKILSDADKLKKAGVQPLPMSVLARKLLKSGLKLPPDILTVEEMTESLCSLNSAKEIYDSKK